MASSSCWVYPCYGPGRRNLTHSQKARSNMPHRNTLLAAAPYFQTRFESDEWASKHYQPSILSVFTVTNLATVAVLAKVQKNASYPWRITVALLMTSIVFTLLAFSTVIMKDISVRVYFGFLMVMVFGASLATGINQNGLFAYVLGFDREEYTQAIMGGQGLAGVLPCIVQILSALAVAPTKKRTKLQYHRGRRRRSRRSFTSSPQRPSRFLRCCPSSISSRDSQQPSQSGRMKTTRRLRSLSMTNPWVCGLSSRSSGLRRRLFSCALLSRWCSPCTRPRLSLSMALGVLGCLRNPCSSRWPFCSGTWAIRSAGWQS